MSCHGYSAITDCIFNDFNIYSVLHDEVICETTDGELSTAHSDEENDEVSNMSADCLLMSANDGKETCQYKFGSKTSNDKVNKVADQPLSTAADSNNGNGSNKSNGKVKKVADQLLSTAAVRNNGNNCNINGNNCNSNVCDAGDCNELYNPPITKINDHSEINDPLFSTLKESRLNNAKSLIFTHINVNSLKKENKAPLDYFKDILQQGFVDMLCVSETKLNKSIVDKDIDCSPQFKVYRKDRSSTSGGLCVWIRSDIPQQRLYHLELNSENYHIESLVFELKIKKETWYVVLAYKNPNVPKSFFIEKLKLVYEELVCKAHEIITLGDLNIDMLCENNELQHDICDIYGLDNIITEPTCFKSPEGTLVDVLLVKNRKRFKNMINVFCGYSDWHHMVGCVTKLHVPPPKPCRVKYRSFKSFDENVFKKEVGQIPFQVCSIFDDISDQYWAQNLLFTDVLDDHAPLKEKALKEDYVPYMNSNLRKEMYKRNMLKNKHQSDRQNELKRSHYTKQRNKVTEMRRNAIKEYFMSKCKPGASPKDFWNAVCPFMSSKSKSRRNIILKEEDTVVTSTSDLCEIFINFFSTAANSIGRPDEIDMNDTNYFQNVIEKHGNHESVQAIKAHLGNTNVIFDFKPVNTMYVKKMLQKINTNKSTGYDDIPPKVVKLCNDELCVTLTELINNAFRCNVFPDDLKKAEISPIYKKKDDMAKDNYRPVSILAVFAKVYETIIADQLMNFFCNIFDDMLCAYRKKYGTQHVLVKLIDSWKCALDEDMYTGTILMDLSKAFDCVPHGLLITKMYVYGLSRNACEFMSSYLSGRYQCVKIANEKSTWMPLLKGVPQGSCLGPLLFNIFMNDIFYFINHCDLINYADDNTLSAVSNTIEMVLSALRTDAESAIKWFLSNFMQVNPSKFQFMFIRPVSCRYETPDFIEINDTKIHCENEVKLLGITIDEKLKFDKHVDILCKKAAKQLNVMYRFKGIFDSKEKEIIYNTFILSNFNYCPIVWHFCGKTSTKKIEAIQERALRFMFNDKKTTYDSLLEKCGYNTLHIRRIKLIATEVFKSLNDLNPVFMKESFKQKDISYKLRDENVLSQPKFNKITYGKNTFKYYGSHIWNLLPNDIKLCTDIDGFKSLLKAWEGPRCQCNMCNALA